MTGGSPNPLRNLWLLLGVAAVGLVMALALTRGPSPRPDADRSDASGTESADGGPRVLRQNIARPASRPERPARLTSARRTSVPASQPTASADQPPVSEAENPAHPYVSEDMLALDDSYEPDAVFGEAAKEFQVPADLLKAVAYVESGANHRHGVKAPEGGFGVMRLREEGGTDTLGEAARLLGTEKKDLVRDPAQNIRGAAALIRSYYEEAVRTGSGTQPWLMAVTLYSGRTPEQAVQYGREIENILREGLTHTTDGGQMLHINPKQDHLISGAPAETPAAAPTPAGPPDIR